MSKAKTKVTPKTNSEGAAQDQEPSAKSQSTAAKAANRASGACP